MADRTCCVCRAGGKPVQIHHIDGDNTNQKIENLAVLCLGCHNETQLAGGFHRKLDADQVFLYRDDWLRIVARDRAAQMAIRLKAIRADKGVINLDLITSIAEDLREREEYDLLAVQYNIWGNAELRDKYIEQALKREPRCSADTEIFLRSLQGRTDLVNAERIESAIQNRVKHQDWSQLARLYRELGRWQDAALTYCRCVIGMIEDGNIFAAAYYLKEAGINKLHEKLFEIALREKTQKGELWWRVRCLQELGWESEVKDLLLSNRSEIEKSDNPYLRLELSKATGNQLEVHEAYKSVFKRMANAPGRYRPIKGKSTGGPASGG